MMRAIAAYEAGEAAAKALKAGDIFTGASPAAEAAGYGSVKLERECFRDGYITHLRRPVRTEGDTDVIVSLGEELGRKSLPGFGLFAQIASSWRIFSM